jgi:hypothetical protein
VAPDFDRSVTGPQSVTVRSHPIARQVPPNEVKRTIVPGITGVFLYRDRPRCLTFHNCPIGVRRINCRPSAKLIAPYYTGSGLSSTQRLKQRPQVPQHEGTSRKSEVTTVRPLTRLLSLELVRSNLPIRGCNLQVGQPPSLTFTTAQFPASYSPM